jgi:hypothetical protein
MRDVTGSTFTAMTPEGDNPLDWLENCLDGSGPAVLTLYADLDFPLIEALYARYLRDGATRPSARERFELERLVEALRKRDLASGGTHWPTLAAADLEALCAELAAAGSPPGRARPSPLAAVQTV